MKIACMDDPKLKQQKKYLQGNKFAEEYILSGYNVSEAARKCDIAVCTAKKWLKTNPYVHKRLQAENKRLTERYEITVDSIEQELAAVANSDIREILSKLITMNGHISGEDIKKLFECDEETRFKISKAIKKINVSDKGISIELHDKVKANELLGIQRGMFKKEVDVNMNIGDRLAEALERRKQRKLQEMTIQTDNFFVKELEND